MNKKTKLLLILSLSVALFLTGILKVFAYQGINTVTGDSPSCDDRNNSFHNGRQCYFIVTTPNGSQAYVGTVAGHIEGHGSFGPSGGRGSIIGCLTDNPSFSGACWTYYPDTQVGDGRADVNAFNSIGADYNPAFNTFWVHVYANDATWNDPPWPPFTAFVTGRKLEITSPTDDMAEGVGNTFTVPWNVEWGSDTHFIYDQNVMTCATGSYYEPVAASGSTSCTAIAAGVGQITIVSNGPSAGGQIQLQRSIYVTVGSGGAQCVTTYNNACNSAANSCGQTSSGTVLCGGGCSAATPSESNCPGTPPPNTKRLTVTVVGYGHVGSNLSSAVCPPTCFADITTGTPITLTATPSSGQTFTGWGGDCASFNSAANCTGDMSVPHSVTATFSSTGPPPTPPTPTGGPNCGNGSLDVGEQCETTLNPGDCQAPWHPGTHCNLATCRCEDNASAVNCVWGSFSGCSVSACGWTGTQNRSIATPASGGGAACTGSSSQACSTPLCTVSFFGPGSGSTIIYTGGSTTLTWSSSDATQCTGTLFSTGGNVSGNAIVSPISTTVYTISCSSGATPTIATWTVTVRKKPMFIEN